MVGHHRFDFFDSQAIQMAGQYPVNHVVTVWIEHSTEQSSHIFGHNGLKDTNVTGSQSGYI